MAVVLPFLENLPKEIETPFLQPDYSSIQGAQLRTNSVFEENVDQVKNDYSAVINAPVTNPENEEAKQGYIKQFQTGLKKITTQDSSMPQNVMQAESLLTPFWNDEDMLYDMAKTKEANAQLQAGENDRLSKDKDIRNSYNPHSINRIQWNLDDLKHAKRGDGSIGRVDISRYNPRLDANEYADASDKAEGFKGVDYETPDGRAGIIKEHDGIKAIPNYNTRLQSIIDQKFNPQFSDEGYNWYRQEKAQVMKDNPGITEDAVNRKLGEYRFNELKGIYANKVSELQGDIKSKFDDPIALIQSQINGPNQKGKATHEQLQDIARLSHQKENYTSALQQASDENDQFQQHPEKVINDIIKSPEDYYARQVRETTIDNMARGRAMGDYSYSTDVNKAWEAVSKDSQWRTNAGLESQRIAMEYYKANLAHADAEMKNKLDNGYTISATGELVPPTGTLPAGNAQYLGENTTSLQHGHFSDILEQEKSTNLNTAVRNTFAIDGVTGVLTVGEKEGGFGLPLSVVTDLNTMYTRLYNPSNYNDPNFKPTPAEIQAFRQVYDKLKANLGADKVPYTYDGVRDALSMYVDNENAKRVATGTFTDTNTPFANAFAASETAKDALANYTSMSDQEREWITHLAKTDKATYAPLLNDAGTGLAGTGDIAKHAPSFTISDKGITRTITPEQVADAYNRKTLYVQRNTLMLDGKTYTINAVNGEPNEDHYIEHGVHTGLPADNAIHGLINRFGNYEDRDKLNSKLAENAASNLQFVKDKTGKIGGSFLYSFGNEKAPGPGEKLIMETQLSSNTAQWYENGELLTGDKLTSLQNALNSQANSYPAIRKNVGQPQYSKVSEYGAPTTTFTINQHTDDKGDIVSARTVTAVQSPDAKGEFITSIPSNSGIYIYQKLLKGEGIKSDNSSNAMGFKYELQPDDRNNPTKVSVTVTRKMYNPATKKMGEYTYPIKTYPLNIGIDNIMSGLRDMQRRSILDLAAEQKQYNAQNAVH